MTRPVDVHIEAADRLTTTAREAGATGDAVGAAAFATLANAEAMIAVAQGLQELIEVIRPLSTIAITPPRLHQVPRA